MHLGQFAGSWWVVFESIRLTLGQPEGWAQVPWRLVKYCRTGSAEVVRLGQVETVFASRPLAFTRRGLQWGAT